MDTTWGEHMLRLFRCWDYFISLALVFLECFSYFFLLPYENFIVPLFSLFYSSL